MNRVNKRQRIMIYSGGEENGWKIENVYFFGYGLSFYIEVNGELSSGLFSSTLLAFLFYWILHHGKTLIPGSDLFCFLFLTFLRVKQTIMGG